jgi:hypothetical protein
VSKWIRHVWPLRIAADQGLLDIDGTRFRCMACGRNSARNFWPTAVDGTGIPHRQNVVYTNRPQTSFATVRFTSCDNDRCNGSKSLRFIASSKAGAWSRRSRQVSSGNLDSVAPRRRRKRKRTRPASKRRKATAGSRSN